MKYIFFLIPLLLVSISFAFAETGYDYTIIDNQDGTKFFTTHEPYIFDGNAWVQYIVNGTQIQTSLADVILEPNGVFTWNNKFSDSIVAKYADISNLTSWTYPNTLNNDIPNISWDGSELVSEKFKAGVGNLKYKYILNNGEWKTSLEVVNLSGLTTKVFGFDQIINLNSDTIKFGGVVRNLDSFDGVIFDKQFLENNQGKVLDLLNGVDFDFDLGFDNLYSVTVYDTGVNSSQLVFDYRTNIILLPNETMIIDPTFGFSSGTVKRPASNNPASGTCVGRTYVTADTNDDINYGTSNYCSIPTFEYNVTAVDDGINAISAARVKYDIDVDTLSGNCVLRELDTQPANGQTTYNEGLSGTKITAAFGGCSDSTGNNKIITLNAAGTSDIITKISGGQNWYAFSFFMDDVTAPSGISNAMSDIQLQFNYTVADPPDAVDDLTYANLDDNSLDLLWTQPDLNGESLINYRINYTSPHGTPSTFLANTTNTYYNVTGLVFGTDYSYRVSALTIGGYNATGNILNVTTTSTTYPTAPSLIASAQSSTQIDLNWSSSSMLNINGYRIQRETPINTGWNTIISNTTNTNLYYNNTGLSTNILYNYRVYALNSSGISQASNTYVMTTFKLPNAVTTLVAIPTSLSSIDLSWSAPTHFAPAILGYQVNYTTPYGNPMIVITNNTGSTAVAYEVTGIGIGTQNSFRVSAVTVHGKNTTGNIVNATSFSEFTIGNLSIINGTNDIIQPVLYSISDYNATTELVTVRYPNTVTDFRCDLSFKYANTNQTYANMTADVYDANYDSSDFILVDADNEVIDFDCWDNDQPEVNGQYTKPQSAFPFKDQIDLFRAGTFSTSGDFGAIDLITLIIIIVSMVAFNKTNPAMGIVVSIMILGATSFLGIITLPSIMLGVMALIAMVAIVITRR